MSNNVVVTGNLARDPELRYTPQGKAVVTLSVGDTPRNFDRASGTWTDGVTDWVKVVAWEALAENVAASLKKGDKVVVIGTYKAEKYTDKTSNEERTSRKLVAEEVSPSLTFAVATVEKKFRPRDDSASRPAAQNSAPAANTGNADEMPF
jgi:single-strand DNA-binding protein